MHVSLIPTCVAAGHDYYGLKEKKILTHDFHLTSCSVFSTSIMVYKPRHGVEGRVNLVVHHCRRFGVNDGVPSQSELNKRVRLLNDFFY